MVSSPLHLSSPIPLFNAGDIFPALTVIDDSVTLRSNDLALLKLTKLELDTSGAKQSLPVSSDISCKYKASISFKFTPQN